MSDKRWPGWLGSEQARIEEEIFEEKLGKVAQQLRDEIRRMDLVDTGRLLHSVKVDARHGRVVMTVPYGEFVEHGRRAGRMPPYQAIRRWVGHKLHPDGRKTARNVTWAIMMKIKREGIPATHILERAWRRVFR